MLFLLRDGVSTYKQNWGGGALLIRGVRPPTPRQQAPAPIFFYSFSYPQLGVAGGGAKFHPQLGAVA